MNINYLNMKKTSRLVISLVIAFAGTATLSVQAAPTATQRADTLLKQMTLEEKLRFVHAQFSMENDPGGGAGYVQGVPRLHIPDLNMADSSTGSGSKSQASTTFPATIALAASWDLQLSHDYGAQIATELRAQGFGMGLGGGTNLAREPRGGRLFEYLGEDPLLAGELLAQRTLGTQSQHVMASIKHFAGNEQESFRMGGNSQIDERTLRELYLLPFEIAVKSSAPASVMCSYNRLNGDYACENQHLLNDILKKEWKFQGQVQSDWGGDHSTAKAINAGLDEEEDVKDSTYLTPSLVSAALKNGEISQARLDDMVRRKLIVMIQVGLLDNPISAPHAIDFKSANAFAQSAEEQSIVLLKNQHDQLPLDASKLNRIALIGAHADTAVMAGGGSGDTRKRVTGNLQGCDGLQFAGHQGCDWWTNPWMTVQTPILSAIKALAPHATVTFSGNSDEHSSFRAYTSEEIAAAVALARQSDVAIVVVAQPAGEDFGDLKSLSLANPSNQNELVVAVAQANPKTVVVIENGNPVLMPWKDKVAAIVEAWYPGEGGGIAIANVLFGKVNPSGKLPLSFPVRDQDSPTWGVDGSFAENPVYEEKLNIGYRWYDAKGIQPLFEFGYGLSYTHFAYSNLSVHQNAKHAMTITFSVKNDGAVAGAEIPQVYLGVHAPGEPPRRLAGWQKVYLQPGEARTVNVTVTPKMQSIWDSAKNDWVFVAGSSIYIGASSRDIRLSAM